MTHDATTAVLVGYLVLIGLFYVIHRVGFIKHFFPPIVLFLVGGVAFSPSVLGKFNPELQHAIVTPEVVSNFTGVGFVGIIIYLIMTGGHIEFKGGGDSKKALVVAITSTVFPMALSMGGSLLLMALFGEENFVGANGTAYLVMWGMALSCTVSALAVLSSIYYDQGLIGTPRANLALLIATAHEIGVWSVVAYILSNMPHEGGHAQSAGSTFVMAVGFVVVMFVLKITIFSWIDKSQWWHAWPATVKVAFIAGAGFIAALATHQIGVHYAFGAIVLGAMLPHGMKHEFEHRVEGIAKIGIYISFMGSLLTLDVNIGSGLVIGVYLAMLVMTYVGQIVGASLPLRMFGLSWPEAMIQAADLTVKGVVEMVVNTAFLTIGLITPELFTAVMMMAATVTALNVPLTKFIEHRYLRGRQGTVTTGSLDLAGDVSDHHTH